MGVLASLFYTSWKSAVALLNTAISIRVKSDFSRLLYGSEAIEKDVCNIERSTATVAPDPNAEVIAVPVLRGRAMVTSALSHF